VSITEQKILNAIKHFSKNTRNVGRTKLFKLLYFLDFMYFKRHGLSITCYEYSTYPFGPVPQNLYNQILSDSLPESFKAEFKIVKTETDDDDDEYMRFRVALKNAGIDYSCFTPYEKEMLETVSFIFKEATAKEMTEITHLHNSPWDKTKNQIGMFKPIDYFLAVDDETTLDIELLKERFDLQKEQCLNGRL